MKILKIFLLLSWNGRVVDGGHLRRKWDLSSSFPPLRAAFADTFFLLVIFCVFLYKFSAAHRCTIERNAIDDTSFIIVWYFHVYVHCACIFIGFCKKMYIVLQFCIGVFAFCPKLTFGEIFVGKLQGTTMKKRACGKSFPKLFSILISELVSYKFCILT